MYYLHGPRFRAVAKYGTDECLAPNAYYLDKDLDYRKNVAPFNQSSQRSKPKNVCYTETIYDGKLPHNIRGGSSLRNRAPRFPEDSTVDTKGVQTESQIRREGTPGPGTYNPKLIKPKGFCCRVDRPMGIGKLYLCKVPCSYGYNAPSVPTKFDTEGYEVDENDMLHKRLPAEHDQTLGPAFYEIPFGEVCFTTKRYHEGWQWGKSRTRRTEFGASNDNPGPGHYDLAKGRVCRRDEVDEYVREMARLFSFTPRFLDKQQFDTLLNNYPAPGYYDIPSIKKDVPNGLSVVPTPMVCAAKRFKEAKIDKDDITPGPNHYRVCDCYRNHKQFSLINAPFQVVAEKLPQKKTDETPGPQSYDTSNKIFGWKGTRYTFQPFNHTAERGISYVSKCMSDVPGPKYNLRKRACLKSAVHGPQFRSKTTRFIYKYLDTPDPGEYDVSEAARILRERKTFYTGKVGFLSKEPKRTKLGEGPTPEQSALLPGPSDYEPKLLPKERTCYFSMSPRYKESDFDTPGPGSYKLHPSVGMATYKSMATHNLLLKKNVLRALPKDTTPDGKAAAKIRRTLPKGAWAKELKKPKVLKWFTISPDYFEHCPIGKAGHVSKCHVKSA